MAATILTTSHDPYLELIMAFPLRPIRGRSTHQRAKEVLRALSGKRGSAVRDYKTVLGSLIADYERDANLNLDISKITAAEVVLHLLDERNMSVTGLAKSLGISQSSLSEMLNGRREWSKSAILRVSRYFGLKLDLFLR